MNLYHNCRTSMVRNHQISCLHHSRQRGVGLIEILVSVLILSLGLLGMAGLQANALKANQSAHARSQAVMLSYYMLDAMRADKERALKTATNNVFQYNTNNAAGTAIEFKCLLTDFPNGTTLQNNSRYDWLLSMKQTLNDLDTTCGAIECRDDGTCTVRVRWDDSRAGGLGDQTVETTSRL